MTSIVFTGCGEGPTDVPTRPAPRRREVVVGGRRV
jgi:hypothetical protein